MSKGTGSTVECPVCGEQFDPMAAGGWCTNPDCGEWRQEVDDRTGNEGSAETGAPAAGPGSDEEAVEADSPAPVAGSETDSGESFTRGGSDPEHATAEDSPSEGPDESEADGDADDSWGAFEPADSGASGEADDATGDTTDEGVSETPDRETPVEESGRAGDADQGGADSLPGTDEDADTGSDDVAAGDAEPVEPTDDEEPDTLTCPGCAAEVTAEAKFCPECGTDISGPPDDETGDEQPVCYDCGAEVAEDDSFCASCGADLTDAEPDLDLLTECPACDAPVDGDAEYCASCGEHLEPHRDGEEGSDADTGAAPADAEPAPEALTLSARGREVRVADGDAVGRQVRRIIMDTDGDEDKAVRIHREHVRFVREGGQFYVVDLGDNPTVVNGTHMEKGDRQLVGPGDELALSGVVTLSVGHP